LEKRGPKIYFFHLCSDVQDILKFLAGVVLTPKILWSINVIMTSYLQKFRHKFSSSGFYFIAYRFCCDYSRGLKLDLINKWDLGNFQIELWLTNKSVIKIMKNHDIE